MTKLKLAVIAVCAALASACSHMPNAMQNALHGAATPATAQERVHAAIEFLDRGEVDRAKTQLDAALRQEPGNVTAQALLADMDGDMRARLGARSRAYVVKEGDTMTTLAERFLGDPLRFYALARYNDMTAPNQLAVGQTLRIPDRRRPTIAAVRRPAAPTPSVAAAQPATPPPPVAHVAAPSATAVRANQLRLQGLQRLNSGDADGAVVLLRQAQGLDANNAAIQRDLARAQRIQASLRSAS